MKEKNKPRIKSLLTTLNLFITLFNLKFLILIADPVGTGPVKRYKGFITDNINFTGCFFIY